MREVLSFFSGISFILFGLACFYSDLFIDEFYRYGLSEYRTIVGFFQLLGGIGSILGFFDKRILDTIIIRAFGDDAIGCWRENKNQ